MNSAVTIIVPSFVKIGQINSKDECAHIAHTGQFLFEKGTYAQEYLQFGPSDSYEQTTHGNSYCLFHCCNKCKKKKIEHDT